MLFIKENLSIKIPPILQFLPVSEAAFTSLLNKKELVVSGGYMINKKGLKELKETFVKEGGERKYYEIIYAQETFEGFTT